MSFDARLYRPCPAGQITSADIAAARRKSAGPSRRGFGSLVLPVVDEVLDHCRLGQSRGVAQVGDLGDLPEDAAEMTRLTQWSGSVKSSREKLDATKPDDANI